MIYVLCHAHYRYRLQLPYKSHRTYLTNRMGSISHHITPPVINSLGADTHTHIHYRGQKQFYETKRAGIQPAYTWFK